MTEEIWVDGMSLAILKDKETNKVAKVLREFQNTGTFPNATQFASG
jgi:hypothetical protein